MTRRLPHGRSGITLTEVLISILIMGVGMISLAAKLAINPAAKDAASAIAISTKRDGGTGCGETRGGSITRNWVPPAS